MEVGAGLVPSTTKEPPSRAMARRAQSARTAKASLNGDQLSIGWRLGQALVLLVRLLRGQPFRRACEDTCSEDPEEALVDRDAVVFRPRRWHILVQVIEMSDDENVWRICSSSQIFDPAAR